MDYKNYIILCPYKPINTASMPHSSIKVTKPVTDEYTFYLLGKAYDLEHVPHTKCLCCGAKFISNITLGIIVNLITNKAKTLTSNAKRGKIQWDDALRLYTD